MIRYTFLFVFFLFSQFLTGQEEWTLERSIQYALENNLSIKQSEIAAAYSEIDTKQALHSRYPTLNSSLNLNTNFGRSVDPITNDFVTSTILSNGASLSSGVTLFNGFRITNSIKKSKIDRDASHLDLEQAKRDIALAVANSYLQVLFAQENLEISKSQFATTQEQLSQMQRMISAGLKPANESLELEAQIANNEQMIVTGENSYQIALLRLKQMLRLDADVSMVLQKPEEVYLNSDPDLLTFDEVYESAYQNQPNLQAGMMRLESAKINEQIAKASLMPNVSLGGSIGSNYSNKGQKIVGTKEVPIQTEFKLDGNPVTLESTQNVPIIEKSTYFDQLSENLSYGVGLSVSYPIYNNYSARANIQRSKLATLNSSTQLELLKDQLKTTVQQALSDARGAKKKQIAAERTKEARIASLNNAEKKYAAGTINSFELISLKNALAQAEVNAIIAKYEYIFAVKVLDFYMGKSIKL